MVECFYHDEIGSLPLLGLLIDKGMLETFWNYIVARGSFLIWEAKHPMMKSA